MRTHGCRAFDDAPLGVSRPIALLTTTTALSFGSAGSKSGSVRPSASGALGGSRRERLGERRPGQGAASESSQAPPGLAGIGHKGQPAPAPLGPSEPRSNTGAQGARPG